jgi:hypothetical protein
MKTISRIFLFGALTLVLLTAACTGQEGSPTPAGTTGPREETSYPPPAETEVTETAETATASPEATLDTTPTVDLSATAPAATDTTETPGVPVTGADLILLECQFCVDGAAHAMLVLPDTATFETVADTATLSTPGPDMGCNTVDTYNGRQIVICRGEENTSLNLNICTDGNNCTQLLVDLQTCPDAATAQPGATDTPGAGVPTDTPGAGVETSTPTPADIPTDTSPTPTP